MNSKINISEKMKGILLDIISNNGSTKVATHILAAVDGKIKDKTVTEKTTWNHEGYPDIDFAYDKVEVIKALTGDADYYKVSSVDKKYISLLSKDKIAQNKDNCVDFFKLDNLRTRVKPGKIVKKIFTKEYIKDNFTNTDIEHFVNQYVSEIEKEIEFIHAKGEDIMKYYLRDSYQPGIPEGTLWGSCMNHAEKQEFLKIYRDNDNISLIVALSPEKKVIGRAILWEGVTISNIDGSNPVENQFFMDRIYHSYDWLTNKFKNYAKKNGYHFKKNQTYDSGRYITTPKGENVEKMITIKLENFHYMRYPYIDTMYVPNYKDNTLSNNDWSNNTNQYTHFRVHDSGMPSQVWSTFENDLVKVRDSVWSVRANTNISLNKSVQSRKDSEYWHQSECLFDAVDKYHFAPDSDTFTCVVTGSKYEISRALDSNYHKGQIHKNEAINTLDEGLVHKSEAVLSKLFNTYTTKKGGVQVKELNDDFVPKKFVEELNIKNVSKLAKILKEYDLVVNQKNESDSESFTFEF